MVSAARLVDLWYVTQTTQAFTTEDLDAVRDVVAAESTALELVPIELDVFDAWRGLDRRVLADPWDRFIVATAISEGVRSPETKRSQNLATSPPSGRSEGSQRLRSWH